MLERCAVSTTRLRIIWEGQAPGLAEGRLSLAAFGSALQALLKAARNIAFQQVAAAVGEEFDPSKATRRTLVDLQLSTYQPGSSDVTLDVVPLETRAGAASLVEDLAERVVRELFESIRAESRGTRRNRWVNEYLQALPQGLSRQRYSVIHNGNEEVPLELGEIKLAEPVTRAPQLLQLSGVVAGVSFGEPLKSEVRFAPYEGQILTLPATAEQVEQAVALRGQPVKVMALLGDKPRLLWIRHDEVPVPRLTAEQREEHIFRKWEELLRRLAQ